MSTETATLRHLMEVGRQLLSELDPDRVFAQVLEEARLITGARYAAIGVLNEERTGLNRFLTAGIEPDVHRAIGELPRGLGVLGVLIDDPRPLRLDDVGRHPESFGFPYGHPDMKTFLGVPIVIRGEAWGNLYLAEKSFGLSFTIADEEAVGVLAQFAATAIDNARAYQAAEQGRQDSMRAIRGLEAARAISDAIGAEVDLETILELIIKRGRALVNARSVLILLTEGDKLVLVAGTGTAGDRRGLRVDMAAATSAQVLETGRSLRIDHAPREMQGLAFERLGLTDVQSLMIVPMIHHGQGVGVLAAIDRGAEQAPFTDQDEELMQTFASSAANAVAISRSVEADRLRATIAAAEEERRRWARELHDQTLQSLGALRIMLSSARRKDELERFREAVGQAIEDLEYEISNLRGIIADLRPPLLDDIGLVDALGALVNRYRDRGLFTMLTVDLMDLEGHEVVLTAEMETTIYRLVQEALTNVIKHARAASVSVSITIAERGDVALEVRDDGTGFDTSIPYTGFGLAGIRERTYLAGGTVEWESGPEGGTTLLARLPTGVTSPLG